MISSVISKCGLFRVAWQCNWQVYQILPTEESAVGQFVALFSMLQCMPGFVMRNEILIENVGIVENVNKHIAPE